MTQLVLNIENIEVLPLLKKVVSAFDGVSIASDNKKVSGIEEAFADVESDRVTNFNCAEDAIKCLVES